MQINCHRHDQCGVGCQTTGLHGVFFGHQNGRVGQRGKVGRGIGVVVGKSLGLHLQARRRQHLEKALRVANARHRVTWEWVKGHAGHPENERADALARAGMAPFKK